MVVFLTKNVYNYDIGKRRGILCSLYRFDIFPRYITYGYILRLTKFTIPTNKFRFGENKAYIAKTAAAVRSRYRSDRFADTNGSVTINSRILKYE